MGARNVLKIVILIQIKVIVIVILDIIFLKEDVPMEELLVIVVNMKLMENANVLKGMLEIQIAFVYSNYASKIKCSTIIMNVNVKLIIEEIVLDIVNL